MTTKNVLTFSNGKFFYNDAPLELSRAYKLKACANEQATRILNKLTLQKFNAPPFPDLDFLDPHQLEGINWVLTRSRSYLAHAPGAGKTLQAIVAGVFAQGTGQVLFIVPPPLTKNWEREINKWTRKLKIKSTQATIPASSEQSKMNWLTDFIICPDSMLAKPWVQMNLLSLPRLKLIAVDEASRFKEVTSLRTKALFGGNHAGQIFSGLLTRARHVTLLDGSPMPNRPTELWAPLYAMAPETIDFMGETDFGFKYCNPRMNSYGKYEFKGSSNEQELKERIQKDFMHVVPESALGHPERMRTILPATNDPLRLNEKLWERRNLSQTTIQEIIENGDDAATKELSTYRRLLGVRKAKWCAGYVKDRLKVKNESILLFAWHREVVEILAEELKEFSPGVVLGGTNEGAREFYFDEFQKGNVKLIIGNIGAMGRGHNLQRADRVIFAEYSWTDETNIQCEKRASRKGRAKNNSVRCEYIIIPESLDEIILNAVMTKAKRVEKIIGGGK